MRAQNKVHKIRIHIMSNSLLSKLILTISLLVALFSSIVIAAPSITIDDLVDQKKLTISSAIHNKEEQIVGQPLIISIEVATSRWFSKGTQVNNFSLLDTVILANSNVLINGSKRVDGESWSTQITEITLYPTRSGEYQLPSIDVSVSINTDEVGAVSGTLSTLPNTFLITLPDELVNIEHFVVSPDFTVAVNSDFDESQTYIIGDAITRIVMLTATNTPAMMLPPILSLSTPSNKIEGLSIYQKPAQVFDKSNRGNLVGTRVETATYIFERAGEYSIPDKIVYWWDSESSSLEEVVISGASWQIGDNNSRLNSHISSNGLFNFFSQLLTKLSADNFLYLAVVIALLILLIIVVVKYKESISKHYSNRVNRATLKRTFLQSVKEQQYLPALSAFYKYQSFLLEQNKIVSNNFACTCTLLQKLNKSAFASNVGLNNESNIEGFTNKEAKQLLLELREEITTLSKIKPTKKIGQDHIEINNES